MNANASLDSQTGRARDRGLRAAVGQSSASRWSAKVLVMAIFAMSLDLLLGFTAWNRLWHYVRLLRLAATRWRS